ncbi:hypothetical protein N7532_005924 [Penicillium argentinense]|uniref:Pre-mRNA splicing factor CLF1 n=1 Tax=Penicillium argentinense TaxID=1131581 RepID=A0A9W9KAE9_9EURO|nr:uncharacterized protein N7532_005924 [Penicillium argentinense]KAJ5098923.1 hypothetical protein N7532_005924 [Penicillium argentinense]
MTVPEPPYKLEGHCSVIYSNTLYAFSKKGLLSIPLSQNGTWSELSEGSTPVSDAVCVLGGIEGNEDEKALYVVGGTGDDQDYPGLQRYSFKDNRWDILGSARTDFSDRTGHGAAYLSSSASIVVYSGSQTGDTTPSSQSWSISAKSPYDSSSVLSQGAPPAYQPMLLSWNSSDVAMIGGQQQNGIVYVYGDGDSGWAESGASLPSSLDSSVQVALMDDGSDGKILLTFNMDGSSSVTSYALVNDNGEVQSPASELGSSKKRSLSDYPTYGDKFAPTQKWSDYSVASQQGIAVLSGGGGDNSLAIFNQTSNSWANATELFYGKPSQHMLKTHTTTSSTSSSTPTPTATSSISASATTTSTSTSTPAPAAGGSSHAGLKTILGATLGSVCGVALILLLLLFFLRRKKQQQAQNGKLGGNDSKDRLSFQDQGIEPLANGAYPMAKSPVPVASISNDSLAIMSGHVSGEKTLKPPPGNAGYGLSNRPRDSSPLSPIPSSGLAPSSMYSQEPEGAAIVAGGAAGAAAASSNKAGDRTTDEGWGKYFEDSNSTSNLGGMPADRSTVSSVYTKSDYRGSAWPMANLTPVNFGLLDQPKPLGQVYSGSPTTENPPSSDRSLAIPEAQSARISSADSISLASDDDPHDTAWTGAHKQSWLGRPPSSNYSTSFYNSSTRDLQNTNSGYFPDMSRQSHGRRSSVVIPDDIDELRAGRDHNVNSDMSWLNIHADR